MKAMFLADMMAIRKYLAQQVVIALVVGAFIDIMTGSIYATPIFTGTMIVLSISFSVIALDEAGHWQEYRLALPLSRGSIVRGRYLSLLAITAISMVVGLVTSGLVLAAAWLLPSISQFAGIVESADLGLCLLMVAVTTLVCLGTMAIMLPICFRMGMTKAVRWIPLIGVLIFLAAFAAFSGSESMMSQLESLLYLLETPAGFFGILAAAAVLYGASCLLSERFYLTRQF